MNLGAEAYVDETLPCGFEFYRGWNFSLSTNWPKFLWIQRECIFTSHSFCEKWNLWKTIFPIFHHFEWKNCQFQLDSFVKLPSGNRNSKLRTVVKHASVKYHKVLSSKNFPWTWIHWPITNPKAITYQWFLLFAGIGILSFGFLKWRLEKLSLPWSLKTIRSES